MITLPDACLFIYVIMFDLVMETKGKQERGVINKQME